MSWFSVDYNVTPAVDILRNIRSKVAAIREPIFAEVNGPIRDAVANDVNTLVAPAPNPVKYLFEFATLPSRNWYFWMKRTGQIPGQDWDPSGGEWDRTGTLESGWDVSVNTSANEAFMTLENDALDFKGDNFAQAVYGPDAVPGHEDTGWGENFDDALDQIADHVEDLLLEALDRALADFLS
jgi:hypothetical protein